MLLGHHMKKRLSKNKSDIYFVYPGNINAKVKLIKELMNLPPL